MYADLATELLNELGSSLENLETQQGALMQFLRDNGIVTDEQLAPYLSQAGNASSVRWRAARIRLEHLITIAADKEQLATKQQEAKAVKTPPDQQQGEASKSTTKAVQPPTKEKAQPEEKKSETGELKPTAPAGEPKPNRDEGKASPQARDENAA